MARDTNCIEMAGVDVRKEVLGSDGPQGRTVILPASLANVVNLPQGLLRWREPKGVPRVVGLHIGCNKYTTLPGGVVYNARKRVVATITWGHDGGKFPVGLNHALGPAFPQGLLSVNVDVLMGVTLSVYGSYVEVSVTNESETEAGAGTGFGPITVSGVLNPEGPLVSGARQPRRSFSFTAGASTIFDIPMFATTLDLLRTANGVAYALNFLRVGGGVIASVAFAAGEDFQKRPIPIPQGANQVEVAAPGSGESEIIFYLDL